MTTSMTSEVDYQDLIQSDRINGRIYYDPAIFREELDKIWYREWDKEQADAECIQVMVQGSHARARVRGRTRTRIAGNCDGGRIDRVN